MESRSKNNGLALKDERTRISKDINERIEKIDDIRKLKLVLIYIKALMA